MRTATEIGPAHRADPAVGATRSVAVGACEALGTAAADELVVTATVGDVLTEVGVGAEEGGVVGTLDGAAGGTEGGGGAIGPAGAVTRVVGVTGVGFGVVVVGVGTTVTGGGVTFGGVVEVGGIVMVGLGWRIVGEGRSSWAANGTAPAEPNATVEVANARRAAPSTPTARRGRRWDVAGDTAGLCQRERVVARSVVSVFMSARF